ncbi:flagellar basal body P-ring formation chaperone FlgA [Winslowiella iniecta]|uniref:Flagella basal body P-ring formation protein FlgA n=1 Tax=Winslowiella iniecta TaxID=1560201 RepID=A0A0L7T8T5_9GAMM|nr:flagellar basal body P-ring formation chaperone FlgA [Winslowiella iniecta]KOC91797.1 flagellar basal body P-ring biosynthesis protein FlgA [Winslowiella iniecta]KOC95075.1 flagellar basal body P-ring biosynthesis protein FlgA [Winslowiella iniecta]
MHRATPLLAGFLGLLSVQASAADLAAQLNQFFKARDPQHARDMQVVLRTPAAQWPPCETPQFSLPGNSRPWGNISVAASCAQQRRYLQVQVQVSGQYVIAARQITRGSAVSTADLQLKRGRLDILPARAVLNPQQAIDAISVRDISPGQAITLSMVRQPWRVKAGQNVLVIAQGEGFNASGEGRALNNAVVAQSVRVRMGNGQIVNGKVAADGNILITL